jgi:hypothetical protein
LSIAAIAVRGVLCASCNSGLGYFTDDTGKLENAKLYLARARPRPRVLQELALGGAGG